MGTAYRAFGEHLVRGRFNFATDQITVVSTTLNPYFSADAYYKYFADVYSGYFSTVVPPVVTTGVISLDNTASICRVVVPDIVLTNTASYPTTVHSLLFYKDTGDPATSPLIGWDAIETDFPENFALTYKSATDGLIQIDL